MNNEVLDIYSDDLTDAETESLFSTPKDSKKGKIEIEYYSMDELDRIMDLFRTIEK